MNLKKVLIASGIALAGMAFLGYQKVQNLKSVFDRMTIRPSGLSNIKVIGLSTLRFDLSIKITNPTNEAFSVSGISLATFKRIMVYRKGEYLGMATINLGEIEIPAGQTIEIKNVPFEAATINVLKNLLTIESLSIDQLTMVAVVEVLGTEYTIEN